MNRRSFRRHDRRGFTAIELTAVASIIAILALILVPIVRARLEQVRITAAQDDMRTIEVAQVLANADTGQYFRLSDLDNSRVDLDAYNALPPGDPQRALLARSVPNGFWNRPLNAAEAADANQLGTLGVNWAGPYTVYNKTKFVKLDVLKALDLSRIFDLDGASAVKPPNQSGPVLIFESASTGADPFNDDTANQEDHPIDPWGGPYIFFGPGRTGIFAGPTALSTTAADVALESNFGTAVIYSMGPNGVPGNTGNIPVPAIEYFREPGVLGAPGTDDLYRIF